MKKWKPALFVFIYLVIMILVIVELNNNEIVTAYTLEENINDFNSEDLYEYLLEVTDSSDMYLSNFYQDPLILKVRKDGTIVSSNWGVFTKNSDSQYLSMESEYNELSINRHDNKGSLSDEAFESKLLIPLKQFLTTVEQTNWKEILDQLPDNNHQTYELRVHSLYQTGEQVKPHPYSNGAPYMVVQNNMENTNTNKEKITITQPMIDILAVIDGSKKDARLNILIPLKQ